GLSRRSVGIRPGVSRNSMVAWVVFFGLKWAESQSRRSSGTLAIAIWPRWLAAGSGLIPVSQWKTVLLPVPAKPAMPTFMAVVRDLWSQVRSKKSIAIVQWRRVACPLSYCQPRIMCDEWMPGIRLPLTWEQYQQLPRNADYKYEYLDGVAYLTPRPKHYHAILDLQPLEADPAVSVRRAEVTDFTELIPLFAGTFRRIQPF